MTKTDIETITTLALLIEEKSKELEVLRVAVENLKKSQQWHHSGKRMEDVVNLFCDEDITKDHIISDSRLAGIVNRRYMAIYTLRIGLQYTLKEICGYFHRDHSTVIYAVKTHRDRMQYDIEYRNLYNRLIKI